jgi:hypothetical protein
VTAAAHEFIGDTVVDRPFKIWYRLDTTERPYKNISSTYLWGWSLVNEEMPALKPAEAEMITPGLQLVLLVKDPAEAESARTALRRFEVDFVPKAQRQFGAGDVMLWVIIADTVPLPHGP